MLSVSCICPTFGRPWNLEEAIESFHRQDYEGSKELVVLNDYGDHTLRYEHENVRLLNQPGRKTIGEKRNMMIESARGDIIVVWDDDDISLPHRISQAVSFISEGFVFFRPDYTWYSADNNQPRLVKRRISWPQCAYTKDVWRKAGGYPHVSKGEDVEFARRVNANGISTEFTGIKPGKAPLIYRMWSNNPHASYGGNPEQIQQAIVPAPPNGVVDLDPKWNTDYERTLHQLRKSRE